MFSNKSIRVVIQKEEGEFFPGTSALEFKDLPIDVKITGIEGSAGTSGTVKIYGVSREHMNMITTTFWQIYEPEKKYIKIFVKDNSNEDLLYEGQIITAIPNYNSAPDVYIEIQTSCGWYFNIQNVPAYSFKGPILVSQVCEDICNQYGLQCDNYGVMDMCKDPYFNQDGLGNRIYAACKQYGINYEIRNNYVKIFPKNNILVSGLNLTKEDYIGYPSFTEVGIVIRLDKIYHDISYGDLFRISGSEVDYANNIWQVCKYEYNLSTKRGGVWEMSLYGQDAGGLLDVV